MTDVEMVLRAALVAHAEVSEALAGDALPKTDRIACQHIALALHHFAAELSNLIEGNMPQ